MEVSYRLDARKLLNLELLVSEAEGVYYLFFPPVRSQRSNNVLHLPTEVINRASGSGDSRETNGDKPVKKENAMLCTLLQHKGKLGQARVHANREAKAVKSGHYI